MKINPILASTNCKKNNNIHFKKLEINDEEINYIAENVTNQNEIEQICQYGDELQRCENLNFKFGTYAYGLTVRANRTDEAEAFATMHEHKHQSVKNIFQKCSRFCEEIGVFKDTNNDVNEVDGEKFSDRLKRAISQ